ncbi:MAG: O-antigen ligase family protein [Pirellulales bacterium]
MSTLTYSAVASPSLSLADANTERRGSKWFVAMIIGLATAAYMVPFEESWTRSSYDESLDAVRSEEGARNGTLSRQIAMACLGAVGIAAIATSRDRDYRIKGILGVLCGAYLMWCFATIVWTDDLWMTTRRLISLGCEVLLALAIAKRVTPRQFVWIIFWCTLIWLSLGIVAELAHGTFRPTMSGYRFAGLFHPNIIGANCALLAMSSLYLARGQRWGAVVLYPIAATAVVFLALTGSRTALGALLLALTAAWFLAAPGRQFVFRSFMAAFAALCLVFILVVGVFDVSTDWLSMGRKDHDVSSLTGRMPLWQELLERYIRERPLLGYGYGAFWTDVHIDEVSKSQGWQIPYAHSTYIDLLLNVGYIGSVICLVAMVVALFKSLRLEAHHARMGFGMIAMIIIYALVDGLLETNIGNTCFLSFFSIVGVCLLQFSGALAPAEPKQQLVAPRRTPIRPRRRRAVAAAV